MSKQKNTNITEEVKLQIIENLLSKNTSGEIKELVYELNTGETGFTSEITEKINGCFDAIILETDTQVHVSISLEDLSTIKIYDSEREPIVGQRYIPIRVQPMSPDGSYAFTQAYVDWALNDKLRIEVDGPRNVAVKIKVRYR